MPLGFVQGYDQTPMVFKKHLLMLRFEAFFPPLLIGQKKGSNLHLKDKKKQIDSLKNKRKLQ